MFAENLDFYPTPNTLINKMLGKVNFKLVQSVLEPSAGKGDIAESIKTKFKNTVPAYHSKDIEYDIDVIELNNNLQHILRGKNFKLVHDDFLTYCTYKKYDLIIMNPPFSCGDKHLLKAIQMQEKGGQIICVLNAETLKNPYNNFRKDLIQKLEDYNADIQYIKDAFTYAERATFVEIALIHIDIPKKEHSSVIIDSLKKEEQYKNIYSEDKANIINADFINGIIQQYNYEVKAGLKLIAEYNSLKPFMLKSFKDEHSQEPILNLTLKNKDDDNNCSIENSYIKQIRMKYWEVLFKSDQFMGLFTSNLKYKYLEKINELRNYDFSLYNIQSLKIQINKEMINAMEETILNLFEELSNKYHWYSETSKNIHYYNGWKTNKAYKINKKVIIPLNGFSSWNDKVDYCYKVIQKLTDIEKVFNYLNNGLSEEIDLEKVLKEADRLSLTKKIELKYFNVTFYKKGTCHIEFKNLDLLHKFNLFGSQRKGWLPPTYSKTSYESMSQEEREVIDQFEGQESYNKVLNNKNYFIIETSKLLKLA